MYVRAGGKRHGLAGRVGPFPVSSALPRERDRGPAWGGRTTPRLAGRCRDRAGGGGDLVSVWSRASLVLVPDRRARGRDARLPRGGAVLLGFRGPAGGRLRRVRYWGGLEASRVPHDVLRACVPRPQLKGACRRPGRTYETAGTHPTHRALPTGRPHRRPDRAHPPGGPPL